MPQDDSPRWLAPAVIVLLALLGGLAGMLAGRAWLAPAAPDSGPGIRSEGQAVGTLQLRDLDGKPVSLEDYAGEAVLVNFWATWCPPCVKELPMLNALHRARGAGGLTVLTIAQEDDPAEVRRFLQRHAPDLPAWIQPPREGDASRGLGNSRGVLPFSVLIDGQGKVLKRKAGAFRQSELDDWAEHASKH